VERLKGRSDILSQNSPKPGKPWKTMENLAKNVLLYNFFK
jgi:hypothetical protein